MRPSILAALLAALVMMIQSSRAQISPTFDPSTACGDILAVGIVNFFFPDGSVQIINPVAGIGCVSTRHYPNFAAAFNLAKAAPGWTFTVVSAGSNTTANSSVKVDFAYVIGKTKLKHSYLITAGKTKIT